MPAMHLYTVVTTIVNGDRILFSQDVGGGVFETKNIDFEDFVASLPTFTQGSPGTNGVVPGSTMTTDDGKFLQSDGSWAKPTFVGLGDSAAASLTQYDFVRVNSDGKVFNTPPPGISYTPDNQGSSYSGIDNTSGGNDYASITDLNGLRTAYENLRAAFDALLTWVLTNS